jgi:hypothetical protein
MSDEQIYIFVPAAVAAARTAAEVEEALKMTIQALRALETPLMPTTRRAVIASS